MIREPLPRVAYGRTLSFRVNDAEGYLLTRDYPDGRLAGVTIKMGKQGSTLGGLLDAFSALVSVALQCGIPLQMLVDEFRRYAFEPSGLTEDAEVPVAESIIDYVFRRLEFDYLCDGEAQTA